MLKLHLLSQHISLSTGKPCHSVSHGRIAPQKHCLGVGNVAQIAYKEAHCRRQLTDAIASSRAAVQPVEELLTRSQNTSQPGREVDKGNGIMEGSWAWRNYTIRYQRCGDAGPPVLLLHGFGGNCDHWRKNLPVIGRSCRAYAIDLLGYGFSDKPDPRQLAPNAIYNFATWGGQAVDFIAEIIKEPAVLVCNSVGGLTGLQAAQQDTRLVKAVQVHNISLRMLHLTKQTRIQRVFVARLQRLLRETRIGETFFRAVAQPRAVRNILRECYGNKDAVDEELVNAILKPGLLPGAPQVFLDFISYSGGPLPEDLLRDAPCPVSILWGDKDPWEKVEWGREFKEYDTVEEFIELPGVGHCPHDEAPDLVNPRILDFVHRHATAA